jgi:hypothetical protein
MALQPIGGMNPYRKVSVHPTPPAIHVNFVFVTHGYNINYFLLRQPDT